MDDVEPFDHLSQTGKSPDPTELSPRTPRGDDHDFLQLEFNRTNGPFVWQQGVRLLLLDEDAGIWSFAELQFVHGTCRYVELRRAAYEMEREAVGALLSRALASGFDEVARATNELNDWLIRNFGHTIDESSSRPRTRIT